MSDSKMSTFEANIESGVKMSQFFEQTAEQDHLSPEAVEIETGPDGDFVRRKHYTQEKRWKVQEDVPFSYHDRLDMVITSTEQ